MSYLDKKRSRKRDLETVESTVKQHEDLRADVLLCSRSAKFAALADLFRLVPTRLEPSIRSLMEPCPNVGPCPVTSGEFAGAAKAALAWIQGGGDECILAEQHAVLFGETDAGGSGPCLPARAELYLSDGFGEIERTVEALYVEFGFAPARAHRAPSHIVNELEFMAYLLDRASRGDIEAWVAARDFLAAHLLPWAVVFSAATSTRAEHPVTRYAGFMLEQLLLCEADAVRGADLLPRVRGATA
ncbi:MAG: molecular chaperone TorD family protein [Coriobacteriia bacterium]|nr:molecular chaperone TorD family protein [Coriobacteriia bacterium]